jgi:hypothetical protein
MDWKKLGGISLAGFVFGAVASAIGLGIGKLISVFYDPTGWSDLIFALGGIMLAYPFGVTIGTWLAHVRFGGKKSFQWAFFPALTGLFLVIFLSEPLKLNTVQPLMWAVLFILPVVMSVAFLEIFWKK